jgi:hypothetical protein
MKSLTRLDPSSQRPWVRAPPLISIAQPPGELQIASGEFVVKDLKRPRAKYSLLGTKIGFHRIGQALHSRLALRPRGRLITAVPSSN